MKQVKCKEAAMKKIFTAVFIGLWLLLFIGCSSTPPGTDKIADLNKKGADKIGSNVVVVGIAETKTPLGSFKMFKIYDGGDFVWVKYPDTVEEPPQGIKVRVFGSWQKGDFTIIGKVFYVDANKVAME
jgi:hypothetical protein